VFFFVFCFCTVLAVSCAHASRICSTMEGWIAVYGNGLPVYKFHPRVFDEDALDVCMATMEDTGPPSCGNPIFDGAAALVYQLGLLTSPLISPLSGWPTRRHFSCLLCTFDNPGNYRAGWLRPYNALIVERLPRKFILRIRISIAINHTAPAEAQRPTREDVWQTVHNWDDYLFVYTEPASWLFF